jgi:hypothetical protein
MSSNNGSAGTVNQSGNGGTYDGKPGEGKYIRQHPSGCDASGIIGLLEVGPNNATLRYDLCQGMEYGVEFTDPRIVFSRYNRDYLGFNSGIFEAEKLHRSNPQPVELWCRHQDANRGLDVVIKTNGEGYLYRGENLSTNKAMVYPRQSLSVRTQRNGQSLSFQSASVEGSIDLSSSHDGIFRGQLVYDRNNGTQSETAAVADCRVLSLEPALYASPANIMAIYQMDGSPTNVVNGASLIDSSAHAHSGIISNSDGIGAAIISEGRHSQALRLDGRNDYADISVLAQTTPSELTVSMFLRPAITISDDSVAFAINSAAGANVVKVGTGMCGGSSDRTNLSLEIGNLCYDTGKTIVDGNWHEASIVISGGRVILYLNEVEVANHALAQNQAISDHWSLGADYDVSGKPSDLWQGDIDEVVVWSTALPH